MRHLKLYLIAAGYVLAVAAVWAMQYSAMKRGERLGFAEAQVAHQEALDRAQAAIDIAVEEQRQAAQELAAARQAITEHLGVLENAAIEDGNAQCVLPPASIVRLNRIAGFGESSSP